MITGTLVYTWLKGRHVGDDAFGNRYYEERKAPATRRTKRWVIYKGIPEGSKVPPEWHAWLHYTVDAPVKARAREWQKDHHPNLSGTSLTYLPPGHDLRGGERPASTGDYEAWQG